jgi:hypothetical protein
MSRSEGSVVQYSHCVSSIYKISHAKLTCLNETYIKVRTCENLSDMLPIKQWDALSSLLFNFVLKYAIKKVQENQARLKVNGAPQLPVYAGDLNMLEDNIYIYIKHKKNHRNLTWRLWGSWSKSKRRGN